MISFTKLLVKNSSIRDTMEIIDIGSLKTAFVDTKNQLIATVSDGDIRGAIKWFEPE